MCFQTSTHSVSLTHSRSHNHIAGDGRNACTVFRFSQTVRLALVLIAMLSSAAAPAQSQPAKQPANSPKKSQTRHPDKPAKPQPSNAAPTTSAPASTQPAQPLAPDSIAERHNELTRLKNRRLNEKEIALRAALEFMLAVGSADGEASARVVEAVGYQPLTLGDRLPNPPTPTITIETLRAQLTARKRLPIRDLPLASVEIVKADDLRERAPAISRWMLPDDWAIVIDPSQSSGSASGPAATGADNPDDANRRNANQHTSAPNQAGRTTAADLFTEPAILVMRVRAGRPTVMGGNFLSALR